MTRITRAAFAVLVAGMTGCVFVAGNSGSFSASPTETQLTEARTEISSMMDASARAWTRGDLDGFMDSYERGSGITYVTPAGVVHGRDAIRARYAPRFASGSRQDSLSFENLEVDLLAPDLANVIAYYRLSRGDSTTSRGPTSLVMRRRDGQWRIIHDHSS
jgi:uncharacterized protein (TIGR02246 family)